MIHKVKLKHPEKRHLIGATYSDWTKTTLFMLPALGEPAHTLGIRVGGNFLVNSFIGIKGRKLGNYVYLLLKIKTEIAWESFMQRLRVRPCYVSHEEVDIGYTLVKLRIPEEFEADRIKFLNGEYSELSPKLKHLIKKFTNANIENPITKILNKSHLLRWEMEENLGINIPKTNELCSPPILEDEKFNSDLL